MGIASLGSFAGGLASGMERGQIMANRAQENRHRKMLMDAERDQMDAVNQARAAAQKVLADDAAAYQQSLSETGTKTLGDSIGAATAATGAIEPADTATLGAAAPAAPAPRKPYVPDDMAKLRAATAFSDKLLELGRVEDAAKAYGLAESRRAALRGKAAQGLLAALSTGGDITPQLKQFYDLVDDGHSIGGVEIVAGSDGKPAYKVTRVDRNGNALPPTVSSPAQIEESVARMVSDPATLAKHAWEQKLALFKSDLEMSQIRERGYQDRVTAGTRANYELQVDQGRHKLKLGEISAKGAEDRKTDSAKEGLERTRPYTLADGADRFVDQKQPDGSIKPTRIAGNPKDGGGAKVTTAKQINDMVINNYGVLDVGTGKQVGSNRTQQLSAAAEILIGANPTMGANEAIERAARDLGLNLVPKK